MFKSIILLMISIFTLAAAVNAASFDPPEWFRTAEVYNGWYQHWSDDAIKRMEGISVVAGVPLEKDLIDKAHKMGVKVIGYVTFYQMPPGQVYQNEDLAKHPEWNVILPDGSECKSVFDATENTGWKTMCPNSPSYKKAALEYVKYMMDLGLDGLFIDNAHPDPVCEGPKFGRHKHIYPGNGLDLPYKELLKSVRALVKSYGNDKITIANPGTPTDRWLGACDAQMLESYIYSWAWECFGSYDDDRLLNIQKKWSPLCDKGEVVVSLSYFRKTDTNRRDNIFYSYAWARLSGFLWADWFTGESDSNILYKLKLGKPTGLMENNKDYYMRKFERGIVIASNQKSNTRITLQGYPKLFDIFNARHIYSDSNGVINIELSPAQGRVYLTN